MVCLSINIPQMGKIFMEIFQSIIEDNEQDQDKAAVLH